MACSHPDTVAEMREPRSAPEVEGWDASYGLGIQLLRTPQRMLAGHTGSMPGFLRALWVSVDDDIGAVALANTTTGLPIGALTADLVGIVADREPRIPAPWRPLAEVDQSLLELTGPWYWGPAGLRSGSRPIATSSWAPCPGRAAATAVPPADDGTWIGLNGYFAGRPCAGPRRRGRLSHLDIGSFVFTREPYDPDAPIPGGVDPDGWRRTKAAGRPSAPPLCPRKSATGTVHRPADAGTVARLHRTGPASTPKVDPAA